MRSRVLSGLLASSLRALRVPPEISLIRVRGLSAGSPRAPRGTRRNGKNGRCGQQKLLCSDLACVQGSPDSVKDAREWNQVLEYALSISKEGISYASEGIEWDEAVVCCIDDASFGNEEVESTLKPCLESALNPRRVRQVSVFMKPEPSGN